MRIGPGIIVMGALLAPTPIAQADEAHDRRVAKFRGWDRNGDGALDRSEFPGNPGNFRAMDDDGNGVLSLHEFVNKYHEGAELSQNVPAAPVVMDNAFAAMDRNRDGVLTRGEWTNDRLSFDLVDQDDDGRVSIKEYANPPATDDRQTRFEGLDRNNDGVVSRREWVAQSVAFHRADRNGDRAITMREFLNLPVANVEEAKYDALDRDHDGVLERREWPQGVPLSFETADRDDDGVVTFAEYISTSADQRIEERFEDMDHNNDGVLTRWEWHMDVAAFNRRDRNNDGIVTWQEFKMQLAPETPPDRFRELDRNNDRLISRQEWGGDWESFSILDRSRDSRLTRAEYMNKRGLVERFNWLDYNDDGILGRDEWHGSVEIFNVLDRDRDGRVTRDEFVL